MNILDSAYYIINNFSEKYGGITPLKLQKLLYYVKVWGIVAEQDVIEGDFYHWDYGPVNPEVYQEFKSYVKAVIPPSHSVTVNPFKEEKELIDFIVSCYIPYDAFELSKMTHMEAPWKKTPKNEKINEDLIKKYYSKKKFAKNFPLSSQNHFYPVETDMYYAYIFDMDEEDQDELYYSSFQDYLEENNEAESEFLEYLKKFDESE